MKRAEFCKCLRLLLEAERGNFLKCHRVTTMLSKLQFHIIRRADDISNLETIDLRVHEHFNFALQMAVSWSKNVLDEQNCPDQILAARSHGHRLLCSTCTWLLPRNSSWRQGPQGKRFLFGNTDTDDEPIRVNERYQRVLRRTFKHDETKALIAQFRGDLGSHSVQKFPATWAAEHGASQDHVEIRG
jgi:hypothetical protein